MRKKLRFKWKEIEERSLYDIVSDDGALRTKDILFITRQLCLVLDSRNDGAPIEQHIHPQRVIVSIDGGVRLVERALPLSAATVYIPPELDQIDRNEPKANVYALGMLMIFMATGKEKKTDAEAVVGDRALLSLIERCTAFDPNDRFRDTSKLLSAVRNAGRSRKKLLSASLILVFACFLLGLLFIVWRAGRARGKTAGEALGFGPGYAGGYEQGFSDAPGITIRGASFDAASGNLPGNLAAENGAIAVRSEDDVFF